MIVIGVAAAAIAAFILSSVYYVAMTPLEHRALGERATSRGRPAVWKVVTELLRTAIVAAAFAWIASYAGAEALPASLLLALVLWVAFPVVLLTGSMLWENVPVVTASIHAGDWLLKLLLVAVAVGLLH